MRHTEDVTRHWKGTGWGEGPRGNFTEGAVLERILKGKGGAKTEEGACHVGGLPEPEPRACWSWLVLEGKRSGWEVRLGRVFK